MPVQINPYLPPDPGFKHAPNEWQTRIGNELKTLLADYAAKNWLHKLNYGFYTTSNVGVVFVWDKNWKLHIQCAVNGSKERQSGKYPTGLNTVVISLDVENNKIDYGKSSSETLEIASLRKAILESIHPIAENTLGKNVVLNKGSDEHLVWEYTDFSESLQDIQHVAQIMCVYVKNLLPVATEAMDTWAGEHDYTY